MESLSNQRKKNEFYSHFFTIKFIRNFNKLKSVKSKKYLFYFKYFLKISSAIKTPLAEA